MTMLEPDSAAAPSSARAIPVAAIDFALAAQIIVAWAGEGGEEKRLGWWRTDLVSEFGGIDLFRRLLPSTWEWAVLQGAREAARRTDAEFRRKDHDPDRILSLYSLGFELDERLEERLQDLKRSGRPPSEALPGLEGTIETVWNRERFLAWTTRNTDVEAVSAPVGRRLKGQPPAHLESLVTNLVGALAPLSDVYPLPHYRRPA